MAPTITLSLVVEGIIRCILAFIELAVLLAVTLGIPGASAYFGWFVHKHLRPVMSEEADLHRAQEAFIYFFVLTICSTVASWGALPYYSIREELPAQARSCLAGAFFVLSTASTVSSLRILFYMRLYWHQFAGAGLWYLAEHCQAMSVFLSTLLGANVGLVIVFISYTMIFGYPTTISPTLQQMQRDTREVLRRLGLGTSIQDSDDGKL